MTTIYYTAPPDKAFEELKRVSISFWKEGDRHPSYVEEKVKYIEAMQNFRDNFMTIFAMFDIMNQIKIASRLSPETLLEINHRLSDGGNNYQL